MDPVLCFIILGLLLNLLILSRMGGGKYIKKNVSAHEFRIIYIIVVLIMCMIMQFINSNDLDKD